jgi:GTP:adenosylcobinamide-phosphate guanylyltransferase
MNGFGNGIIKKLVKAYKSILSIFKVIGKHVGAIIDGFIDMFAYTSLLIPVMNGVLFIINKYNLNLETIVQNFIGLSVGVGTIIAKHGISFIVSKLKDKFKIDKDKIISDIDTSDDVRKFGDIISDGDERQELIKEQ